MKNITLAIDEDVLKLGREYAREHNVSFNALVRQLIEKTVVNASVRWVDDAFALMDKADASSQGRKWTREELYRA